MGGKIYGVTYAFTRGVSTQTKDMISNSGRRQQAHRTQTEGIDGNVTIRAIAHLTTLPVTLHGSDKAAMPPARWQHPKQQRLSLLLAASPHGCSHSRCGVVSRGAVSVLEGLMVIVWRQSTLSLALSSLGRQNDAN